MKKLIVIGLVLLIGLFVYATCYQYIHIGQNVLRINRYTNAVCVVTPVGCVYVKSEESGKEKR